MIDAYLKTCTVDWRGLLGLEERPKFSVRRVDLSEYPDIVKIADLWQETAKKNPSLEDSAYICAGISDSIKAGSRKEVYVCELDSKKPLGLMMASQESCPEKNLWLEFDFMNENDCLKVSWLASSPESLLCVNGKDPQKCVRGIGKTLLLSAENRAKELDLKGVSLISMSKARGFYEKQGFSVISDHYYKAV